MFRGIFGNYSLKTFIIEYKRTSLYLQNVHNVLLNNGVFFRCIFCVHPAVALVTIQHNYERHLELILVDRPNLHERTTKKRDPSFRLITLLVDAGSQIDLLALPPCSPLQIILPHQLNIPLLFLQPYLFCWNIDSEEKFQFRPLLFIGLLIVGKLLEYNYQPKFIISPHLIR